MRVGHRLHTWLQDARVWCHLARYQAVLFAMEALLDGGVLTLSGLGRACGQLGTSAKHRIKRIDRLLGNSQLALEVDSFSRLLATKVIGESAQPCLLVDWTPIWGSFYAL